MRSFASEFEDIVARVGSLHPGAVEWRQRQLPGNVYFLPDGRIVAFARDRGDSRYPYGRNGFNLWVHASGYIYANEGLFSLFLPATDGAEPGIAFFAGLPNASTGTHQVYSLLPVPVLGWEAERTFQYTVISPTHSVFVTDIEPLGLSFALRVHVASDRRLCFSLLARNHTNAPRELDLASYLNPFLRHQIYRSDEDKWFKEVRVIARGDGLAAFLVQVHEEFDRSRRQTNYAVIQRAIGDTPVLSDQTTTSRYQFVGGSRSSLHTPLAAKLGCFDSPRASCSFSETAIAGDMLKVFVGAQGSVRYDLAFSLQTTEPRALEVARRGLCAESIDADLNTLVEESRARHAAMQVKLSVNSEEHLVDNPVRAEVFCSFFDHLKNQVEFCALIKGHVQLAHNALIGVRDVAQALEALALWQPEATRTKLLELLQFMTPQGRCFRQYSTPTANGQCGRMDLRLFVDQGCWVIAAVCAYLWTTGDADILEQRVCFHEILDEGPPGSVRPTTQTASVMEHLWAIMGFLLQQRDPHSGCVRALYGDWNDALDGLGTTDGPESRYGDGVSIMATLQVYQNTQQMMELMQWTDTEGYSERIQHLAQAREALGQALSEYAVVIRDAEKRILHGWGDCMQYTVGGFDDPDGVSRDGLTSNAFWAISGMLQRDPHLRGSILAAFERLDSKYGYRTFFPAFGPETKGVGRICRLPAGTAENGAVYVHATAFAIMALFEMGCPERAWKQLRKILPISGPHARYSHSPFVMPNSYGEAPDIGVDGESMNDWQTGSSNVVLKILVRYVFGFEPRPDGVWVQPATRGPLDSFAGVFHYRGCPLRIEYCRRRSESTSARRSFTVEKQPWTGTPSAAMGLDWLWLPVSHFRNQLVKVSIVDSDTLADGVE